MSQNGKTCRRLMRQEDRAAFSRVVLALSSTQLLGDYFVIYYRIYIMIITQTLYNICIHCEYHQLSLS